MYNIFEEIEVSVCEDISGARSLVAVLGSCDVMRVPAEMSEIPASRQPTMYNCPSPQSSPALFAKYESEPLQQQEICDQH